MVSREKEKIAVLILSTAIIALSLFPDFRKMAALCAGCTLYERLLYPLAHANIIHAAVNAWCLISITFSHHITASQLLAAYAIAVSFPTIFLNGQPVVGISGLCFALLGIIFWQVRRKRRFISLLAAFIAIGFLFPSCAAFLHAYCATLGIIFGLLTTPINIITNIQHKSPP